MVRIVRPQGKRSTAAPPVERVAYLKRQEDAQSVYVSLECQH
jgi:hypothetical protein